MVCVARGYSIVGALALVLAGGCEVNLADSTSAEDETETGGQTSDPGGDPEDSDGADETTGEPGTGGPSGATDGDGGDSTGESDSAAVGCEALGCSGGGYCDDLGDGPVCVCDPGWASVGLDCIECETLVGDMLPAVVPAVRTTFTYAIDGAPPPTVANQYAQLSLRNRTTGDVVPLADTFEEAVTLLLVPGTYDLLYEHREGDMLPRNNSAVLEQVIIEQDTKERVLDIETATLRGAIAFAEGDEPQSPATNYGRLWAVNAATGDRVRLGDTFDATYDVVLVPGTYEVRYEVRESGGQAPQNHDAFIQQVEVGPGSNAADITVEVAHVSGRTLIDNQEVLVANDNGDLELRDVSTGDRIPLGGTEDDGGFQVALVPGTYEVLYTSREVGSAAPTNVGAIVHQFSVGNEDVTQDVRMRTAVVSGTFSLNDNEIPTSEFDDGVISLESASEGTVPLGITSSGSYSARVLVGSYDVFYGQQTAGVSMPANTHAKLDSLTVDDDASENIDIRSAGFAGEVTIAGLPAPTSPYDDGRVFLRNADSGDKVLLGNTRQRNFAARVVPGVYDVIYENEFSETQLPVNRGAVIMEGVTVEAGLPPTEIDVPVATLEGAVQIEGSTPSTEEGVGNLFLRDVNSDDAVFIGHTGTTSFSKPLTNGTYLMEYRGVAAEGATLGESLPANEKAAFACFEVVSDSLAIQRRIVVP